MQYKSNTKIIIDKRKLDILFRLGVDEGLIIQILKTGSFEKTNDPLINDNLETLIDVKTFTNWGGNRKSKKAEKLSKKNQLENQDDNQLENQDDRQVVDKDKDKDKEIDKDIVHKTKGITSSFVGKPLEPVMRKWLEYRKQIKKPYKSPIAIEECYKRLEKLSGGSVDLAEKVVNQSIAGQWQGLFELKQNINRGNQNGGNLDFNKQDADFSKYDNIGRTIK